MLCIPLKEFQFWKKKQLSKGGDHQSFDFLLDVIGGLSQKNLNLLSIHQEESLDLKENLWELLSNEWSLNLTNQTKTVKIGDIDKEIDKILKGEQVGRVVIEHEV